MGSNNNLIKINIFLGQTFLFLIRRIKSISHQSYDIYPFIILGISLATSLYGLFNNDTQSLISHDEGLYSRRAKEILLNNDWFTPFNNVHHKTIGAYWLLSLSIKFFGTTEFAVRLPSVIFSGLTCLSVYYLANLIISKQASLITSISLISMPLWIQYSRYASPDMPYCFCIVTSVLLLYNSDNQTLNNNKLFKSFISGFLLGLAFFLRSFMILLPILSLLPFLIFIFHRSFNGILRSYILGIITGFIPTIISLYYAYYKYGSEALYELIGFAQRQAVGGNSLSSIFYYPIIVLIISFPFGFISLLFLVKNKFTISEFKIRSLVILYPLIFIFLLIIKSKTYPHYVLLTLPFVSILFGCIIDKCIKSRQSYLEFNRIFTNTTIITLLILLFVAYYIIKNFNQLNFGYSIYFIVSSYLFLQVFVYIILSRYRLLTFQVLLFSSVLQLFIFTYMYGEGILGSPNKELKSFINTIDSISSPIKSNINLTDISSKDITLIKFYSNSFIFNRTNQPNDYNLININSDHYQSIINNNEIEILKQYKDYLFFKGNY